MDTYRFIRLSGAISGFAFLVLFLLPFVMGFYSAGTVGTGRERMTARYLSDFGFPYSIVLFVYTVIAGIVFAIHTAGSDEAS